MLHGWASDGGAPPPGTRERSGASMEPITPPTTRFAAARSYQGNETVSMPVPGSSSRAIRGASISLARQMRSPPRSARIVATPVSLLLAM